ncbi:MAG: spore coat U domain-containing protein [Alphaproteobacteria bacterium]|nr:MAG: spore coat U domain-containing protein [Alphaproteobacteria bacterium]
MPTPRMIRRFVLQGAVALLLLLACPLLRGSAEAAITCTLTGPTLTFGTINIFASSTTSGNATLTCTTTGQAQTFYACLSIGTGTGGTTASNRTLAFGANTIPIQITGGASWPSQIGNGTSYPMEGVVSFSVPRQSSGSYTFPIVVTIPAPSPLPTPGTYASTFTGTDFQAYWDTTSHATCAALVSAGTTTIATGTFSASAIVVNQCGVSATNMNFGSASLLTAALSATAQVSVSCNATLPVTIALDNGATGTGPTNRLMKAGGNSIQYGIYKDSAHSQPWGSTLGTNTATSTGPSATLTAYGQVPIQAAPTPGSYADVVGVTVTY